MTDKVTIIRDSKSGEPAFAVVPWTEYERLRAGGGEDAQMIAMGDAARDEETYPAAIARRLAAGEIGLKVIREWRGITQAVLGEKAEVAPQYISQIERGDRNIGHKTATKLASILDVSADVLLDNQYELGPQKQVRSTMRMPTLE